MRKRNWKKLSLLIPAAAAACLVLPVHIYANESIGADTDLQVYTMDVNDPNPQTTLKNEVIESYVGKTPTLNIDDVDMDASTIRTTEYDRTRNGLQTVKLNVSLAFKEGTEEKDTVGYDFTETAAIRVTGQKGPQIILKSEQITVPVGGSFNYADNIGIITASAGKLPVISETDNVDLSTPGTYQVTISAVSKTSESSASYLVNVVDPAQAEAEQAEEETPDTEDTEEETAEEETETETQETAEEEAVTGTDTSSDVDLSAVTANVSGDVSSTIAAAALAQVGVRQDCTMLVSNALAAAGIYFHGWPYEYLSLGTVTSSPQPGDIAVYDGHVAVYIGDGLCVHGGFNGGNTEVYSVSCSNALIGFVHVGN